MALPRAQESRVSEELSLVRSNFEEQMKSSSNQVSAALQQLDQQTLQCNEGLGSGFSALIAGRFFEQVVSQQRFAEAIPTYDVFGVKLPGLVVAILNGRVLSSSFLSENVFEYVNFLK